MLKGLKSSVLLLLIILSGCSSSVTTEKEFLKWLGDANNGFVKKNSANGFLLAMKYLPAEYLALNEMGKDEKTEGTYFEEYVAKFKNSRTFLLTISNENANVDASNYNVANLREYNQRIKDLSFAIKKSLVLKTSSGKKYEPVLTTMENLYEIANKKAIYMVFTDDQKEIVNSDRLDIVFHDEFLDTGINHFVFQKEKIDNLPNLNFN
ncbi:hypothetical protein J8281_11665 [Aquimarina sp. U1-2]|uniref:hypothetical protein n=1 Tax=Aquimarina sp. U1-2 TaxID=2823141 RepID=UPI001AED0C75|nr:hypothetical protein [Aquimarina sp. U1-2]MBP2832844.1 hypothetical protein [Aquimarina sp. U1-2]